ncbi:alkaline phosphatase family protein [bacterium]|nr:alkaline phosphatase family protein [bacterium]
MNVEKTVYPDYERSIINITASILEYFGCNTHYPALKELSKEYLDRFNNIVFFVVDGLGSQLLEYHLPETSLFRKNTITNLTSVFPPTTSAAISSYLSGVSPLEHGIIGWTLYFKEYFKLIDFLPLSDTTTGKFLPEAYGNVHQKFHFESIFKIIHDKRPEIEQHYVSPQSLAQSKYTKMASDAAKIFSYDELSKAFPYIEKTIKENDNTKLFYCYTGEPDKSMHKAGVYNSEVRDIIQEIEQEVYQLKERLEGTNSLIIVTADHGMIEVEESIYANEEKELRDSLIIPTFPEPRFISCFVHKDKESLFLEFTKKYQDDFMVMSKKDFLKQGLLGKGRPHPRVLDMLGDYILIAIGNKAIQTKYPQSNSSFKFKAMHAGLTAKEMIVPLILID